MSRKYEHEMIRHDVLSRIECDRCGHIHTTDDPFEMDEYLSWSHVGGYSSIFGDGNEINLDLCQSCVQDVLGRYCEVTNNTRTESQSGAG